MAVSVALVLSAAWCLLSCSHADKANRVFVDSLNMTALNYRYASLDSVDKYTEWALQNSSDYHDGRNTALCIKAMAELTRGNNSRAKQMFEEVTDNTNNDIIRLLADVGMMKLYQSAAKNKEFYDSRNRARGRIRRIALDETILDNVQTRLWNMARSEYYMVLVDYYDYLADYRKAEDVFEEFNQNLDIIRNDTSQIAKYCYELWYHHKNLPDTESIRSLFRCFSVSKQRGLTMYEGLSLLELSEYLLNDGLMEYANRVYLAELAGVSGGMEADLPMRLAMMAKQRLSDYGSEVLAVQAYIPIAEYLVNNDRAEEAIDSLDDILGLFNEMYVKNRLLANSNESIDSTMLLCLVNQGTDSLSTEMKWIYDKNLFCMPQLMASTREMLSVSFSALGMKYESDNNRNVYLDVLDASRQDMEMESRLEELSIQEKNVNTYLWLVALLFVSLVALLYYVYRRQKKNSVKRLDRLNHVLAMCGRMTAVIHEDTDDIDSLRTNLRNSVTEELKTLFPDIDDSVLDDDNAMQGLDKYSRDMVSLVKVFYNWTLENAGVFVTLNDRKQKTVGETYSSEIKIEKYKRNHIDKSTCLSLVYAINPYLDRLINEVSRLSDDSITSKVMKERLTYIVELIDKINEYSALLEHWIKIKHGELSLNVSVFSMGDIFSTISKLEDSFSKKGISLRISDTDACVKADRALTLFMVNTLVDNARKFTPEGGSVNLATDVTDEYVEISVEDTGKGLSQKDIDLILNNKVYDSSSIGADNNVDSGKKGHGFGLMNCKGIIEKYRKTSPFFSVCKFGIDSEQDKGSRFFFRLPRAVRNVMLWILMLLPLAANARKIDSLQVRVDSAAYYADVMFNCNVEGYYEETLIFADSAMKALNDYYRKAYPSSSLTITLQGKDSIAEIRMWIEGVKIDYYNLLVIRNESAIAALALKRWKDYHYNNKAYNLLHRIIAKNDNLGKTCEDIRKTNKNKQIVLSIIIIVAILALVSFIIIYFRYSLINLLNMEQTLRFNRKMFRNIKSRHDENSDTVVSGELVDIIYNGLNDVRLTDELCVSVVGENGSLMHSFSKKCTHKNEMTTVAAETFASGQNAFVRDRKIRSYPLTVDVEGNNRIIGALTLLMHDKTLSEHEEVVFMLIAQFVAICLYYSVVLVDTEMDSIELLEDENKRAEAEKNSIHIQNLVIDNCLSAFKHETLSCPNRIKDIADKMLENIDKQQFDKSQIDSVRELVSYYKDIYSILYQQAAQQLSTTVFRRTAIPLEEVFQCADTVFRKLASKNRAGVRMEVDKLAGGDEQRKMNIVADRQILKYFFECLFADVVQDSMDGVVRLSAECQQNFIMFKFVDTRKSVDSENLNLMFSPETLKYDEVKETLAGMNMLVCRQIIREFDEHAHARGCRIFSEKDENGHLCVFFSFPALRKL